MVRKFWRLLFRTPTVNSVATLAICSLAPSCVCFLLLGSWSTSPFPYCLAWFHHYQYATTVVVVVVVVVIAFFKRKKESKYT
jgi:hypothetical protein